MKRMNKRRDCVSQGLRRKEQAKAWMRANGSQDFRGAVEAIRKNERP